MRLRGVVFTLILLSLASQAACVQPAPARSQPAGCRCQKK